MAHKFQSLVKLNLFVCCLTLNCHLFHTSLLLRLYRALIWSKLDYGCISVWFCKTSYIKQLDTVHNQGIRLCLGAFRTSPVQSLYVEANEPPLDMRRTRLSLQYGVKLMSNEVNPAYSAVFQSDIVATYEAKERAIKPLGLRIGGHLDGSGFPYSCHRSIYGDENSTMEANRTYCLLWFM